MPNQEDVIHVQYEECDSAPTDLFVHAQLLFIFDEIKYFDHIIEVSVPTLRCLLESIYRPLYIADLVITITGREIQRLLYLDIFLKISI